MFAGASAVGEPVAEAHASGTGGSWSSGAAAPALPDGTYTAVAEQESEFGNGPGFSQERRFTVHTVKPAVTLNAVSSPTSDSTPSFKGTASEHTGVTVFVFAGASAVGEPVAEAHASGTGGSWSSGAAAPALPDGTYTAVAEQESEFGNGPGFSQERTFTVNTAPPTVTLNSISTPTNDSTPSFTGTASDTTSVTVVIFNGGSATGSPVSSAHASGTGGKWSSAAASPGLADGTYTAVAVQESSVGNGEGKSGEIHFTVDTAPPVVTLNGIASPTNDTTPSFTGFASDTTAVTVLIYKGSSVSGSPVASASAGGTGGGWSSGASAPLTDGAYTAIAVQKSSLGNGEGSSEAIHFTVLTAPPKVTLSGLKTPTGDTTPSFSGTASDTTSVSILIYAGAHASGSVVSGAAATGTGGGWSSGHAGPALPSGEYTAVAVQESSLLGNPAGVSNEVTFVVDTSSPTVTLNSVPSPSNDTTPSFSGSASDSTTVVVHVFNSSSQEVATAAGSPSGGAWAAGSVSKALSTGSYTAVATQASSLGNPAGTSNAIAFTVNTESPHVTLTQPAARSSNTTPSFSGTASDTTTVTVSVFKGTSASGSPVATATATGTGGNWTSGPVSGALVTGTYTALAVQKSSLGNPDGVSETRTFEIDTRAPAVTLAAVARSNVTTPSFTGTASETTTVTVAIYKGNTATGTPVSSASATGTGAAWASSAASPALVSGIYTAVASQKSSIGNPEGISESRTFEVSTKAPTVTLDQPPTPTNSTSPTFTGTANEASVLTVHVLLGATEVATYATNVSAGKWSLGPVVPALEAGRHEYKVFATETSAIGNAPGRSEERSMVVDTTSPVVSIAPVPTPSNNRAPSFSGEASDTTTVVLHVLQAGKEVASAEATPSGGKWKTGPVAPQLASGENAYTAYATQASSLGNAAGQSAEVAFVVNTNPPVVTLEPIATPSNNLSPSFKGAASDTSPVKVKISGGGKTYETSASPSGGLWASPPVSLSVKTATPFTAVATQASTIGNPTGTSTAIKFLVDPGAPSISMTPPKAQINTPTPSFSGTAGDVTPVTVSICRLATECVAQHGEWTATSATGGAWTATLAVPLEDGEYQAVASERSAAGDLGATGLARFTIDTQAPAVTLSSPAAGASATGGSVLVTGLAGTAPHDLPTVTVQLFPGAGIAAGPTPVQNISVPAGSGSWSAILGGVSPGTYTVRALQLDEAGNVGVSTAVTFTEAGEASATGHGPAAAFSWYPGRPHVGEPISLVSSSTDDLSPITAYSWNLRGSAFAPGGQTQTVSFPTPGGHTVQLQVTDGAGRHSAVSQLIPVSYPLMQPFPVVRIAGTRSRGRVRLKALTVQAPRGAGVTVTCTGKGCPLRSQARVVPTPKSKGSVVPSLAFPRFERWLPAGTSLVVRVTHAGQMGKYTRFAVRRGKLPARTDACLNATEPNPVPCTS